LNIGETTSRTAKKEIFAAEKKLMSRQIQQAAETKISAGLSRVTGPAELIEILQYYL